MDKGKTELVITSENLRRRRVAEMAIDALVIDVIAAGDILWEAVVGGGHGLNGSPPSYRHPVCS